MLCCLFWSFSLEPIALVRLFRVASAVVQLPHRVHLLHRLWGLVGVFEKYSRCVDRGAHRRGGTQLREGEGRGPRCNQRQLYSHDHLLASQKRVADELARPQGHGGIVVRHIDLSTCRIEMLRIDFEIRKKGVSGGRKGRSRSRSRKSKISQRIGLDEPEFFGGRTAPPQMWVARAPGSAESASRVGTAPPELIRLRGRPLS